MKKKKTARKGRLALTLSLSVFVFIINTVALLFAIVLVYCLTRLGAIDMSSGQMGLSAVLTVISLTSLVIGFLLTAFTSKIPLRPVNSLVDQLNRLSVIEEESLRLSALANNVLSLTRVENQTILTDISEFNLSEQIRGAVLLLADKWTAKDLNIDLGFDECLVCANYELLKQVWINLLDNAVKFSPQNGTVTVEMTETDRSVTVTVTNSGRDIPPESLAHIFNKFYQADESHSSEGNGIYLFNY